MTRDLLDALLGPDAGADPAVAWLRRLDAAARDRRAGDLATDEYLDGLWVDDAGEDADAGPVSLAADDRRARTFPQTYTDGTWTVVVGRGTAGAYVALDAGPEAVTVEVAGRATPLAPGAEARVDGLVAPPDAVLLTLASGRTIRLTPA
jgi:hypothetical protein